MAVDVGTDGLPPLDQLERMYEIMQTITTADERMREEVKAARVQAAFYPVRGLEAVCAAMGIVLRPSDYLVSTYRNLGDAVAKGVPLAGVVAEACAGPAVCPRARADRCTCRTPTSA